MRPDAYALVLEERDWRARQDAHRERVQPWIKPRLERRQRGQRHPVDDFLFEYYSWRPAQLARWHPGWGVLLLGEVAEWRDVRGYRVDDHGAGVDLARVRWDAVREAADILRATSQRPAQHGCFGRHEWAMVYRVAHDEVRHPSWPLRLPAHEVAAVVESSPLRCTHFDAFRFYSAAARPLNAVQPNREDRVRLEQPGCLHATMDLYKWAYRCTPLVGADLTADLFALARDAREIDMRAAPYDLSALGYAPIRIETPEGRAEYVRHQQALAGRGQDARQQLLDVLEQALAWSDGRPAPAGSQAGCGTPRESSSPMICA